MTKIKTKHTNRLPRYPLSDTDDDSILIFPSTTGTMLDAKTDPDEFMDIERQVTFADFYSLLSLPKKDRLPKTSTSFMVSNSHYTIMEHIRSKLIHSDRGTMTRGLVSLGCVATMNLHKKCPVKVRSLLKACEGFRKQDNMGSIEKSINRLDLRDPDVLKHLTSIVKKYGNNSYGVIVMGRLYEKWESEYKEWNDYVGKNSGKSDSISIPRTVKAKCKSLIKKPLTRGMFDLKRTTKKNSEFANQKLDLNVSRRIAIMAQNAVNSVFEENLKGHFYRAFFVTGLFCLSKWINEGKICKEESDFYHLIDKIDLYTASL